MKNLSLPYKLLIIFTLLITFITRFVRLDLSPPSLSNDEISIAYDAYSVAHTLHDEHNHYLPLSFQSHNTYKAPLAIYTTIPFVSIFGNTEISARLPSAIFGSLTVLVLILLVFKLSQNLKLSILTGFVLSITPWHIYTSRMILESNIALFFVILGLYLFFYSLNRNKKIILFLSFIAFALSIYAYHTEWLFTPLLIAILILINVKKHLKNPIIYIGLIIFFILITPIALDALKNMGTNARANTEILFKDPIINSKLTSSQFNFVQKSQIIFESVLGSYSSYLNLNALFFNGLSLLPKDDPYQVGLFLAPFLICFLIGLFKIKNYFSKNFKFIYLWIILSPLIPALTQGGANFVRNLVSVIPYSLVIGVGLLNIVEYLKNKLFLRFLSIIILSTSVFYFGFVYYYYFPKVSGENFQYGYKNAAQYINLHSSEFQKIIIDPRFGDYRQFDGVPHLYLSYFTRLNPQKMLDRQEAKTGLYFDKYEIRSINWNAEVVDKNALYLIPVSNLPPASSNLKTKLEIRYPNDKPALQLVSVF